MACYSFSSYVDNGELAKLAHFCYPMKKAILKIRKNVELKAVNVELKVNSEL